MKKIYLLAIACICAVPMLAQQVLTKPLTPPKKCATAEVLEKYINSHPGAETTQQFEAWLNAKTAEVRANRLAGRITPGVVLPVVFHIVHNSELVGSGRNISQAAVQQQILQLNKDFANLSNSPYGATAEDMGIQFGLAQNDPNGLVLTEPGIDRIDRVAKGWTAPPYTVGASVNGNYLTATIKPNSIWDPARYLNIWISEWETGILGIATFPASSGLSGLSNSESNTTAGVAIDYSTVGSVFAPSGACANAYGKGKTLTHELGHFFGLRHIWGDAACATDYCNDTPTHAAANSGEPQHPKANSCGTADEMFENYMDYTDDVVTNTFTVNQGDRMEAVFANSPRRATLATSTAGVVLVTASNRIAFADCDGATRISETSQLTTCPKYKDVSILLNVEDKATAATIVTIITGGTAVSGVNYQLMTPTVAFASGDSYKPVILRIFDDGVAAGNKTISLSYSIGSGAGVTAGSVGQSLVVTIVEDDVIKPVNDITSAVTALSENFGTVANNGSVPAGWLSGTFSTSPNIFTVNAQYGAATGFSAADGRALHVTNGTASERLAETAANAYTFDPVGAVTDPTSNAIALTRAISTVGYKNVKLSFDYAVEGEADLAGDYDYGFLYYSTTAQTSGFNYITDALGDPIVLQGTPGKTSLTINLPASLENVPNLWIGFNWTNDNNTGFNPPLIVDNIVVSGDLALGVETAAGQAAVTSLGTGQTAQYVTAASKIIASVSNPNANIGCGTATVASAGLGQAALTTNTGSYFRSQKVITLSPSTANTTATYQATFYFTTAELAVWGAEVPNLKILKVNDGVSLASTLTAANALVVATVVDDQRATKGYASFTGNFTGGFSQFMLVSALTALPVTQLDFKAAPNGKNIDLQWHTTNEINNKGFVVERSTDGISFKTIGWVNAAVGSSGAFSYQYSDNFVQPNQLYYYRLRQTDIDGREAVSETRQARIKDQYISLTLSPNPARNNVTIFCRGAASGLSDINLISAKGEIVKSWKQVNIYNAPKNFDISKLATGIYMVQVVGEKTIAVEKLIIK